MPQFLIDPKQIHAQRATLNAQETKHLHKVLRYQRGDTLWVSDGKVRYLARIETFAKNEATLHLIERHPLPLAAPAPALGVALLKHDHLEWVIQKGVELGIQDFFLFVSERTIPRYSRQTTPKKLARFEKIGREAAKQSGGVGAVNIHPPLSLPALLKQFAQFTAVLIAWEQETETTLAALFPTLDPTRLLVLIGPEGGFTPQEAHQAEQAGAKKVTLGPQILRSETAALVALTLCQYELGNI